MTRGGLLRSPDFLRLWGAQTVSEFGTQIGQLATPLLAIGTLHASAGALGLLGAARSAPFLVLALPAGAILDRVRRRPVMIYADLGRFLLVGTVPVAYACGVLTMWQLCAVAALAGVLTVFFDVAYQSHLPGLVERERLTEANSRVTASRSLAEVAGPGAAGVLVGAIGAAATVTVDSASFLLSGLLCRTIRRPEPEPAPGARDRSLRRDIGEGLGFVIRHPILSRVGVCAGVTNLASSMVTVLIPLYMVRSLGRGPSTVGLVLAVGGAGLVAGSLGAGPAVRRFGYGRTIVVSAVTSGIGLALLPLASGRAALPLLVGGQLLFGLSVPLFNIAQVSLRQSVTPHRLLGRMNASMRFLVWSTISLGSLLAGGLGEAAGARAALAVAGVIGALSWTTLLGSPVPSLRELPAVSAQVPDKRPDPTP
ncbi:MFS transporter [Actinomadura gamaensis]|uniref:MFS transporter n=1 Tax=Actinomadura gamaensis TaxID=1763541 RepID=A0ABV9TXI1_9ACTN